MRTKDTTVFERTLVFVLVALTSFLIWYLFGVILIAFGAIVLAALLRLGAEPFRRWLWLPQSVALVLSVLLVLAFIGGIAYLFGARIIGDLQNVLHHAQAAEASIKGSVQASPFYSLIGGVDLSLSVVIARMFSVTAAAVEAVVVVLVTGVYLAAQPEMYRAGIIALFPLGLRARAAEALDSVGTALRLWLVGQLIQMLLIGLLSTTAVWLIGLPSPLALGLIAGVAEFIPFIGPIIASVPAILVAATKDNSAVIWTIIAYVLIHQMEGNVLVPLIQRRMVYIPPAVILLGIVTLGAMFGFVAIIFAAPITIVVFVAVKKIYIRDKLHEETDIPGDAK